MASRRISASKWRERVAQWRSSTMPAREYAEQQGYPVERLTYWARRVERESMGPQLLPVQVQVSSATPATIELRGPSGWVLRVATDAEPGWLAAVLSGLR